MLKNEQGLMMLDALIALMLVMILLLMLTSALKGLHSSLKTKENLDIYEIYEAGTGLYDD